MWVVVGDFEVQAEIRCYPQLVLSLFLVLIHRLSIGYMLNFLSSALVHEYHYLVRCL